MRNKKDYNRKMVGQTVSVESENGQWEGQVTDISGEEYFVIKDTSGKETKVHMYDIRSKA